MVLLLYPLMYFDSSRESTGSSGSCQRWLHQSTLCLGECVVDIYRIM